MPFTTVTDPTTTRAQKIKALRELPQILSTALQGLNDSQLDTPYREGGWNSRQIVHHIADSHMNAFIRMKLILEEEHPTLKTYDQDAWAIGNDYKSSIEPSLAIITGLQERMATLLENIRETDWPRTAHHPERGEVSLDDLLETYHWHGAHHAEQITTLRKERNW
jgi:hypothetical protein